MISDRQRMSRPPAAFLICLLIVSGPVAAASMTDREGRSAPTGDTSKADLAPAIGDLLLEHYLDLRDLSGDLHLRVIHDPVLSVKERSSRSQTREILKRRDGGHSS